MRLGFVLCHLMHTLAVASLRGLMNAGSLTPLHSPGPKSFIWAPPSNRHYPETYSKQVKMKGRRIEKREGRMDKAHWRKTDGWLIWLSLHLSLHQASFSWAKCCEKFNSSFCFAFFVIFCFCLLLLPLNATVWTAAPKVSSLAFGFGLLSRVQHAR